MCCCEKPTINGTMGYKWQPNNPPGIWPIDPPELLLPGDVLIFDEPGRCGRKTDSHSHHFRLITRQHRTVLLVRHGGGEENHDLGRETFPNALLPLSSDDRYWLMCDIYYAIHQAITSANDKANATWRQAAAEKRIKTRKLRGRESCKVWIEPKTL